MNTPTLRKLTRLGLALLGAWSATTAVRAADYESTVLSYNPLAYWRLNETAGSPAINTVTNHGTAGTRILGYPLGGALTGEPGIVGNSVRIFNPGAVVGDAPTRLDVPNDPTIDLYPPFSVEVWAKPNSLDADTTGACVISSVDPYWFEGGNRSGFLLYVNGSGEYEFRVGGEESYTATVDPGPPATSVGAWSHVVGTFDGTKIQLYVNGTLVGTNGAAAASPFNPNFYAPLRIGATTLDGDTGPDWVSQLFGAIFEPAGNRGFDGWVDEVALYTNILTTAQVSSHYAGGAPNPATYDSMIESANPVLYLNLDEGAYTAPDPSTYPIAVNTGSVGADANGTNELGIIDGQPGVPYAGFGSSNLAIFFTGEQGNVSMVNPSAFPDLTGSPITLMAWIKMSPQAWSWEGDIIAQGISSPASVGGEDGFEENFLRVGDPVDWEGLGEPDTSYYEIGEYPDAAEADSVDAIYPVPPSDFGQWIFLAGTWDGTNWNLYRNGALVAQMPDANGPCEVLSTGLLPNGNAWSIGSRSSPDTYWGWWFGGSIDEPAIFNTALSPSQIASIYAAADAVPEVEVGPQVPAFAHTPAGTVYEGFDVNFNVLAGGGAPPLSYSWYYNGQTLSSTSTNLELTDVTASQTGTYSVVISNAYGTATSAVQLVVVASPPTIWSQPVSEARYAGYPFSFNVGAIGSLPISYQWKLGTTDVGTNGPTYASIASTADAGTYSVALQNTHGTLTSSNVTLGVITPTANSYVATVLGDQPIAYYRLGESSGTVAHDFAGGYDGTYVGDVLLNQAGYSLIDTNTAAGFGVQDAYVSCPDTLSFSGTNATFTLEGWAIGPVAQIDGAPIIVKGTGNNGGNATEQFCLGLTGGDWSFFVREPNGVQTIVNADSGPDGAWHYLTATYDSTNGLNLYVDGELEASSAAPARGVKTSPNTPVTIGAERSGVAPVYDWDFNGTIDEVAIYSKSLSAGQIAAHYAAAYGTDSPPFVGRQPSDTTNYVGLPVTLSVDAGGTVPLNYQWYQVGVGAISGANSSSYTVLQAVAATAGTYYVNVANTVSSVNSSNAVVTILPVPSAPQAVPGLVLHLPFDGDLLDKTGRGNNGTARGITIIAGATNLNATPQTAFQPAGAGGGYWPFTGHQSLFYTTDGDDTNNMNFNFVTLGNRPDLQFGTNENFTVAFWILLPQGYDNGDLPFFSDSTNSTGGFGFNFSPSYGDNGTVSPTSTGWNGAWAVSLYDDTSDGVRYYGDQTYPIADGNWHYLTHVFDRKANLVTYVDGVQAVEYRQDGTSISAVGNLDTAAPANIGQDPTGTYRETGTANIAELGVWSRALAPLEVAQLYVSGFYSNYFYAYAPLVTQTFTYTSLGSNAIQFTWSSGSLQSSTNVAGGYTNVTATSPYTVPVTSTNGASQFFRVKF